MNQRNKHLVEQPQQLFRQFNYSEAISVAQISDAEFHFKCSLQAKLHISCNPSKVKKIGPHNFSATDEKDFQHFIRFCQNINSKKKLSNTVIKALVAKNLPDKSATNMFTLRDEIIK